MNKRLLNDGWEFLKLPCGSTAEEACGSADWEKVDLPHDWLIWQAEDLYESADAWYRRKIGIPPEDDRGMRMLRFDGVYMDCDVLLNGEILCSHPYGYTAFSADLSGARPGENEILVHIRHRSPNSRWYSGSGIFRDVTLLEMPENHIVPDSVYLAGREQAGGWQLHITAETAGTDRIPFSCEAVGPAGETLGSGETESREGRIDMVLRLTGAPVWDPEKPDLCTLRYRYGGETDEKRFGLRTVEMTPDRGLILNHRPVKLKGVCLHHDLGCLGAAFHEKAARRQLSLMKEMGVNALRTSHNPPAERLLDLCDEMGILVDDEAFDMWEKPKTPNDYARFFPEWEERDVASWIRRDRCHPCVILWSIGNEIYDMHADLRGTEVCAMLAEQVRSHDPEGNAAVTFGCNYMPWEGGQRCADVVKIPGYNYGEKLYADHHRKHPDWVIYGSETASVLSSRGIYHFPMDKSIMSERDLQCSALGNSNTSWGATDLKTMIIEDMKCSYSMGQFIWSGIDYIGEPTPYHTRSCYFGQADTACYPKDPFYLFKSFWSNEKVLHIGVYWDWNPGQMIDVPVMTNYGRAELLLNGRSLGIREVSREDAGKCLPVWKVPYEAGTLTARALDEAGNVLAEDVRKSFGETAALALIPEEGTIRTDGYDLAFITVQALDREGNPVENARDRVTVSVEGGARLLGTDNGDSSDPDGYKQRSRRLFGGKLLLVLGSNGKREQVTVRAESTAGISAELTLPVTVCPAVPGNSCLQEVKKTGGDNRIPVRKIEIIAEGSRELTKENPSCTFRWRQLPAEAKGQPVEWEVTNDAGIQTPFAKAEAEDGKVVVTAAGDGRFYLRALGGNQADHPEIISQIELAASGIGSPALNPYGFISAGLYDLHEGTIGTGNEKGIAFDRENPSMVGFSRVDFGKTGSDTMILPVFALDGNPYEIEMFDGDPGQDGKLISVLHYEKPSIWNHYQEETYHLPVRLSGIHTICFRMTKKVHLKGFRFEKQSRARIRLFAGEADEVYGDSWRREGKCICGIGNNVSLVFREMDFGESRTGKLLLRGRTELDVNTVTVRIRNENDEETVNVADFRGNAGEEQPFDVQIPGGNCTVTFVFLPGSRFDFESFRFGDKDS